MSSRLYAVWRTAVEVVRERLLGEPQLSLKTRREHAMDPPSPATVELRRESGSSDSDRAARQPASIGRDGGTGPAAVR